MSRKIKLITFFTLLLGVMVFSAVTASAAAAATTAAITITVTQDDTAKKITDLGTSNISVVDSADRILTLGSDYSIDISDKANGKYTVKELVGKQTYYLVVSTGSCKVSVAVPITAYTTAAKAASAKVVTSYMYDIKKSGAIGGLAVNGSSVLTGAVIKATSGVNTYETTSASVTGAYKLFLPTGKYNLIIVGLETTPTGNTYKNLYTSINVSANQLSGPMNDLDGKTAWNTNENQLGLSITKTGTGAFDGDTRIINGFAVPGVSVSAYVYDNSNAKYSFLASGVAAKAVSPSITGAYKITLPDYQPGQFIAVRARDTAGNMYEDKSFITAAVPTQSIRLTPDLKATVVTPVVISYADLTSSTLNAFLYNKIWSVTATCADGNVTLTKGTHYTLASGKITFIKGVLSTAQSYGITVKATGYADAWVLQPVNPSISVPAAISGVLAAGSTSGATKITLASTYSVGANNALVYNITTSGAVKLFLGNKITGYTAFTSGNDIMGVDQTDNKCIDLVEVSIPAGVIVKYSRFTITTQIKAPTVIGIIALSSGGATTITLTADANLDTNLPAATAFKVNVNGETTARSLTNVNPVVITGKKLTLNLIRPLAKEDTVKFSYTAPATNQLKDSSGNKILSFVTTATSSMRVINNTAQGPTFLSAVAATGSGSTVIIEITMSKTISNTVDLSAFRVKKGTSALYGSQGIANIDVLGSKITLTMGIGTPILKSTDVITVNYTATGTNDVTDGTSIAADKLGLAVTNNIK